MGKGKKFLAEKRIGFDRVVELICSNMDNTYNVKDVLEEELSDLVEGCSFVFEMHDERFEIYRHNSIEVKYDNNKNSDNCEDEGCYIIQIYDVARV